MKGLTTPLLTLEQLMLKSIADGVDPDYEEPGIDVNTLWEPIQPKDGIPSPQQRAIESLADELFFGGSAGGGKSDMLFGNGLLNHQRTIIFRREFGQLRSLIARSRKIIGEHGRFNENLHIWRNLPGDRSIEFGGMKLEDDKTKYMGRPHDLKAFDEIPEFTESQYRYAIAWTRSEDPNQRSRVIVTGNPPTTSEGRWVIKYWAPWLDPEHPNPAKNGELRWFASLGGKDVEVETGKPFEKDGETHYPKSRTFIRSRLEDNPYYGEEYRAVLQGLPEPLRSQLLKGDFSTSIEVDPWQVIPTEWVLLAQKRWRETPKPDTPLTGIGVDVARGGEDKTAFSFRYGNWFDEVITIPGKLTPTGPKVAQWLYSALNDHPQDKKDQTWYINVDIIGAGGSAYDQLDAMYRFVTPINAVETSRYRYGVLEMYNTRAEYYWRFREALDPASGQDLCLPPGNEVLADLCVARWELTARGILIEGKEVRHRDRDKKRDNSIRKRLGRSPNVGDAILLAHMVSDKSRFWSRGPSG